MLKSLLCVSLSIALLAGVASAEEPLARVPLVPSDTADPVIKPFFDGVRARGGRPLNMHRTMANAPGSSNSSTIMRCRCAPNPRFPASTGSL